jgi:hypothetical protein
MAGGRGERVIAASPIPIAGGRVIASPFQFYLDGADNIRVEGWNSCSGAALEVQGRAIDDQGMIQTFNMVLPLTADRTRARRDFAAVRGYILNLIVLAREAAPCIGQTFARVSIIRGFTGATTILGVLLQGYVTSQQGLGWPGSPIQHSLEAMPVDRFLIGTVPSAGNAFVETVPTGARWQLVSVLASLTTAAGGVNRLVNLANQRGGTFSDFYVHATYQPPSTTVLYSWGLNLPIVVDLASGRGQLAFRDDLFLSSGDTVLASLVNFAAGDQWTVVRLSVREWLEVE